jgi:5-methylthioribose kinase
MRFFKQPILAYVIKSSPLDIIFMINPRPEKTLASSGSAKNETKMASPWSSELLFELKSSGFVNDASEIIHIIDLSSSKHAIHAIALPDRQILIKKPILHQHASMGNPYFESAFYASVQRNSLLKSALPAYYGYNELTESLCIEYLPQAESISSAQNLSENEMESLSNFLSVLHSLPQLHHKSFFVLNKHARTKMSHKLFIQPMMMPDIDSAERNESDWIKSVERLKKNIRLKASLASLAKIWSKNGKTLTHGDFKGGNWLRTHAGIKVIDPEYATLGMAEHDTAVFLAHLKLSGAPEKHIDIFLKNYEKGKNFDFRLFLTYTGAEMLRILLICRQHQPAYIRQESKLNLLQEAANLVMINHPKII